MAELQSTDGSFFSRETDEEKSFESNEDTFSMIAEIGKVSYETNNSNKAGKTLLDNGNDDNNNNNNNNNNDARATVKLFAAANTGKNRDDDNDNDNDNEKGNTSDDITTTTEIQKERTQNTKKLPRRKNLNESTLAALQRYLESGKWCGDSMEYEEVVSFASKIHRYAIERTRSRQGMHFRDGTIQNGDDANVKISPIIMTEEDVAQEYLYHQTYQKEEYHAIATKFSKTVMEGCSHDMGEPGVVLHKKTANWLKRAAGMHRQYDPYQKDDDQSYNKRHRTAYSEESDDVDGEAASRTSGKTSDRRLTRRRLQMTRKKRRLERLEKETENFRILADVTLELEKRTETRRTKKGIQRSSHTINDASDDDDAADAETKGSVPKEIGGNASREAFPSFESTGLAAIYDPYRNRNVAETRLSDEDENEIHIIEDVILPPVVARLGLEFRPTPLDLRQTADRSCSNTYHGETRNGGVTNPARTLKSRTLMNALSNKRARRWAIHEFFDSDLDKVWYQNDGVVSDLAKLGFPIDSRTRLTRHEWCLVRRKLRPRPRLFSKKFIAEQLNRRDRYRTRVRLLQQDAMAKEFSPISVDTIVTAYDRKGGTIRRGRILLHDPKAHNYLVQFDDKESGCNICMDSEVAIYVPAMARRNLAANTDALSPLVYELHKNRSSSKFGIDDGVLELTSTKGTAKGGRTDDVERELLIGSIAVATEAFERKKAILEVLESYTDNPIIKGPSKYCSWLLANLDRINTTLEGALAHLQVLYGRVYGSPVSKNETPTLEAQKIILSTGIPKTKAFEELVASLVSVSNKIGTFAFSSGGNDNGSNTNRPSSNLLQHDMSGSTSLLLLANYLAETSLSSSGAEKTTFSSAMDAALKTSLERYSNNCLPPTNDSLLLGKRLERESLVEEELKDLWLAVGMLRSEAALATDENRTFELCNAVV